MARGESGRVVIEIDPALKRELYAVLSQEGKTLKDWFIMRAEFFVHEFAWATGQGTRSRSQSVTLNSVNK